MLEADSSGKRGINNSFSLPRSSARSPSSLFPPFRSFLFLSAEYLNFADSTLPTHGALRRERERAHVERGQYLYWTRERVSESSRGISSGNLQGPGRTAKTQKTDASRAIVASLVALVSCPDDRMPIRGWRGEGGRTREGGRSPEPGWVAGCRRK